MNVANLEKPKRKRKSSKVKHLNFVDVKNGTLVKFVDADGKTKFLKEREIYRDGQFVGVMICHSGNANYIYTKETTKETVYFEVNGVKNATVQTHVKENAVYYPVKKVVNRILNAMRKTAG